MKILYIQSWNFSDLGQLTRFTSRQLTSINLPRVMFEVLYLAGPKNHYDYLDLNLELISQPNSTIKQIITDKLKTKNYDLFLITFPAVALGNIVSRIVQILKSTNPHVPIVIGGSAINLLRADVLKFWPVDYCYNGDGQEIPQILKILKSDKTYQGKVPGLYKKQDSKIIFPKKSRGQNKLVDNYYPKFFYSLYGQLNFRNYLKRYKSLGLKIFALIETTRGCSYQCSFCAVSQEGQVRFRSAKTTIDEIKFLITHKIYNFYVIDPTLGLNKNLTNQLLEELTKIKTRYPQINLEGITRANLIDNHFSQRLNQAGFRRISIGIETMSMNNLDNVNKKTNPNQNIRSILILHKHKIKPRILLIHFPNQLNLQTINFLLYLEKLEIKFFVQSSFLRPLYKKGTYKKPPNFTLWDQRKDWRSKKLDSNNSIIEWLICNLAFPSTDINCQKGDKELRRALHTSTHRLLKQISINKHNIIIPLKTKNYIYEPVKLGQILKESLFIEESI